MVPLRLLVSRVENKGAWTEIRFDRQVFVDPSKIDTVMGVSAEERTRDKLPTNAASVIRYMDNINGFRLLYVAEEPALVARMRFRCYLGEDPTTMDFSNLL